jgi:hypothetical protein
MSNVPQDPHIVSSAGLRWTPPPNWPELPNDWTPSADWRPDPAWGPPPPGWAFLRLSDCAADANLPLQYRDADIDEKFRQHIGSPAQPAIGFLESIVELVGRAFQVSGEAAPAGQGYRDQALRSVRDATDILALAQKEDRPPPFVFFACMQDALSAVKMSAAAATEEDASEKFQQLFDGTFGRVMSLLKQALERAEHQDGQPAREVVGREYEVVNQLVARVNHGTIDLKEGLKVIDELNGAGRRLAAAIGVAY